MKSDLKHVLVPGPVIIGAGPSGLATAACLKRKGVPFLVLERETCLASLWQLKTYDRLRLHLPKKFCRLPHMDLPPNIQEYPTKQEFISYLEAYAKHFSIKPMFGEEVQLAAYDSTMGFWRIRTNEFEFVCRWLIVATGENAEPVSPDVYGLSDFQGRVLHSSVYKNGADFEGKKVLVVGCGNSGMEISLDLCNCGAQASVVVRDKVHILPREMFGRSTFGLAMWLLKWFPLQLVDRFILLCSSLILGDTDRFGLNRPEIGPFEWKNTTGKTPVLDVGTLTKIKTGEIKVVSGLRKFTATGAEFVNGSATKFDSIILATGYRSNVPSWLKSHSLIPTVFSDKEGELFSHRGYPRTPFPDSWKGKKGLYCVGFTNRGLLGASLDAQKVAEDISWHWNTETKRLRMEL